ncbi:hypothetical protein ES703_110054 [subsurface metagenome]
MPDDNVVKVRNELYLKAKEIAKANGTSIADAISRLVEHGGAGVPTNCQLGHFSKVLAEQGLSAPRRPDWVWGVTDVLPAEMLVGTKLEPYAKARAEAELRCSIGDELYEKLVAGGMTAEEVSEFEASLEDEAEELNQSQGAPMEEVEEE